MNESVTTDISIDVIMNSNLHKDDSIYLVVIIIIHNGNLSRALKSTPNEARFPLLMIRYRAQTE